MTEDKAPYAVPTESPPAKKRRGPKPGAKRKPRARAASTTPAPNVWVVYRGEKVEILGAFRDPVVALDALSESVDARVVKAAG